MTDYTNIQQFVIAEDGSLVPDQPRTWDNEPLYSPETVREGLFDPTPFEQMPGQLSYDDHARLMAEAWDGPGGFWENRQRNS